MQAHIAEHLGFAYRVQIEKQLGMNLPPQTDEEGDNANIDPEVEAILAPMIAQAAQRLLAQNQQEAQQQQAQQQQLQAQLQEQQARTELAQARAVADQGLGMERVSRIEENRALAVERRAEASKDEEQALLNLVKALKEIDDIDINQIQKLIALSEMVKASGPALKEQHGR